MFRSVKSVRKISRGFTILEILLAVAAISILAGISFVYLGSDEMKNQGNDSKRIADLVRLHLAVFDYWSENSSGSIGSSSVVYLSLPDTSSTCVSYSLPVLPNGWSYSCSTSANYLKTDGSGWLPISFSDLESLSKDPLNNSEYFYAYIVSSDKKWILVTPMQSEKYLKQTAFKDGGIDDVRYEIGTGMRLWAQPFGTVGYWPLDDLNAYDLLSQNNGTISGAALADAWINKGLSFDGLNDYLRIDNLDVATTSGMFNTVEFWMKWGGQDDQIVIGWDAPYALSFDYECFGFNVGQGNLIGVPSAGLANDWTHVAVVFYNGVPAIENSKIYLDGQLQNLSSCHGSSTPAKNATPTMFVADWGTGGGGNFGGTIDQLKVYNRELSAREIWALYRSTR